MRCPSCGGENPAGKRFCSRCGQSLAGVCSGCGAQLGPQALFCGDCGSPVGAGAAARTVPATLGASPPPARAPAAATSPAPEPSPAGTTELRHVSVLFCDLVGFTPFSENRDPEDVREMLSGYFEIARAVVGRYGGVIQKFIGDAVMALWGAPIAQEDDAERAVRAGLELVSAVAIYGAEHRTGLQARVGVVTGSVATTETAEEGLVIGDRVNTAARIQSLAPPSRCYVDETTRSATSSAIAYVDAGEHALKGKAVPVRLYEATRVVAAVAGSQRSGVLEAPFIGRDHELRLVKELFHGSAERHLARLVLVSGVAGVGKSRLSWEFFKYIDGLAGTVLWHAGRCLSYGEGVSYWALSEMVRARLQISEEDGLELVTERLKSGLERWIEDPADREFISPRLGQLLGLPGPRVLAREELFSGWRLFFERLSDHLPVVMVVEDLQWADAGMVEFLDHLLDWSGDHAIFLLVLTRPEENDHKGLGLSRRSVTSLALDPLPDEIIGQLLDGLVSGLPVPARSRIVERAEGIPLYAIETVRGLLDKGVLQRRDDDSLHFTGELGELEIPPGLTALIASRLDALSPDERRLVKECSVLGTSFARQAIESISDIDKASVEDLLRSLVRKEVLTVRADKLSPERGHYAFTQSLIRSVAYDMLTKAERKARHLRTAEHLCAAFPDDGAEVAEVIGAHLYDAYLAAGDDPDADELRVSACLAYARAAERAESVGAPESAESAHLKAAELSGDERERTGYLERAGRAASQAGWDERAAGHFETAITAHSKGGRAVDAARVTAHLGRVLVSFGRSKEAIEQMHGALASLAGTAAPPEVVADLQASLGRALVFAGRGEEATGPLEEALVLAQHHKLPETLCIALNAKCILLTSVGRDQEARMLLEGIVAVARVNGLTQMEMTAELNLADQCMTQDLPGAEAHAEAALALARRWALRREEGFAAENFMYVLTLTGRLEEALRFGTDLLAPGNDDRPGAGEIHYALSYVEALRGNVEAARQHLQACRTWAESEDVQHRGCYWAAAAGIFLASGDPLESLGAASRAIDEVLNGGLAVSHEAVRLSFPIAVEAAIESDDIGEVTRLCEQLAGHPPGEVPPFLRAQLTRGRALAAGSGSDDAGVEEGLIAAEAMFRQLGYPYWTARAQLDRAEWLASRGRLEESAPLAGEAAETFAALGAAPMRARARARAEPGAVRSVGGIGSRASS